MINLLTKHWWLGFILGIISLLISMLFPLVNTSYIVPAAVKMLRFIVLILFGLSILSCYVAYKRKKLLYNQTGLESIRKLSWAQFETLITEAYQQNGYKIIRQPLSGSDNGIDIIVGKEGLNTLIQCKHWRSRNVGVKTVREMYGILISTNANEVHIISSGSFTNEAGVFAKGKPIKLIDGKELLQLVGNAQEKVSEKVRVNTDIPSCPKCGSSMVLRKARKGKNTGNEFWGCIRFPECRGTMNL